MPSLIQSVHTLIALGRCFFSVSMKACGVVTQSPPSMVPSGLCCLSEQGGRLSCNLLSAI